MHEDVAVWKASICVHAGQGNYTVPIATSCGVGVGIVVLVGGCIIGHRIWKRMNGRNGPAAAAAAPAAAPAAPAPPAALPPPPIVTDVELAERTGARLVDHPDGYTNFAVPV